jgi:hypothetical protein
MNNVKNANRRESKRTVRSKTRSRGHRSDEILMDHFEMSDVKDHNFDNSKKRELPSEEQGKR